MRTILWILSALVLLSAFCVAAVAQMGDVAIALGTTSAPSGSVTNPALFTQGLGGGTYFGFNGDVLIKHYLGFEADVNWKTSQGLYAGQVPFRPLFLTSMPSTHGASPTS
jgi:hypothetical protein